MRKTLNLFALMLLAAMLTTTGCKKETTTDNVDLMQGAVEYNGTYPDPEEVAFQYNNISSIVNAYPGQAIVYFKSGTTESDASSIITTSGGTVLAKIPVIGYYLVSVTGQVSNFISAVQGNSKTEMALPHIAGTLSSTATILDNCNATHGQKVQSNLEHCGGTMEKCVNIMGADVYVLWNKIVQGISAEANSKKNGPVLINISASGFNMYDNRKWTQLTSDEKEIVRANWFHFMRGLFAIYNFPEQVRKNVVVTIASGNGDMPITDLMAELKQNAKMAKLLSENVLVVSNSSTSIGKGNYTETDPDVVVLDNTSTPDATSGTSYSAPCALGLVQRLIDEKGATPKQALQMVKTASMLDDNRVVTWSSLEGMVGMEQFASGPRTLVGNAVMGDCVFQFNFALESITANWNGSTGSMAMPTGLVVNLQSGVDCSDDGTLREMVMTGPLTGNNSSITGILTGYITTTSGTGAVTLKFTGQKSGDKITGTLQSHGVISFPETIQLTLDRQ